ncbi:MAG: hypothetical protein E7164_00975 [Firmicutes bacterium]|nr:hypothetical protein [Bacillota bacterium]
MFLDFLGLGKFFWGIIIGLVASIFQVVNYTYQIFLVLAKQNIFEQEHYAALTEKIYVVLGVVMLFVIAYNFLMLVVDPDKNKGGASVEKMLKNIVTSFILIVLCPSLFSFAFKVSDAILDQQIFTKFFSDVKVSGYDGEGSIKAGGYVMASNTFEAFFNAANGNDAKVNGDGGKNLQEAKEIAQSQGDMYVFNDFATNVASGEIEFYWFIAIVAGCYLCYVIVSFCFDLAVRVCKLAFYQIIAPIAISSRILPDKANIFKNWWSATYKTYIALFIRIFIMNLGVYLISIVAEIYNSDSFWANACDDCSAGVQLFANAFIILGVVTFMKAASKLIEEIFNFGDVSLGIKEKLKGGGAFAAGAAVGSGVTAMTRNATHAYGNFKDSKGKKWYERAAVAAKGVGSTIAGAGSGTARGLNNGKNAGSWSEMVASSRRAADETIEARGAREDRVTRYRASGNNVFTKSAAWGHIADVGAGIKDWATGGAEQYNSEIRAADAIESKFKKFEDASEDIMKKKLRTNTVLVADMTDTTNGKKGFKGDDATVARLNNLFEGYRGMSMAAIEADIDRLKGITDFSAMVDKQQYTVNGVLDNDAYLEAVELKAREHANKVADLNNMYNQLWKESRLRFQDDILKGDYTKYGLKSGDITESISFANEVETQFKADGSYVRDEDEGKEFTSFTISDGGHKMDDIVTAYKHKRSRARSESSRIRQAAESRNAGKDKK